MIAFLDILLVLALLSALPVALSIRRPPDPEGAMGTWPPVALACLCLAILLVTLAARGMLGFLPGGGPVWFVAAVGAVVAFGMLLTMALDHNRPVTQGCSVTAAYLLLAACAAAVHRPSLPWPGTVTWGVALVLGPAGIAGWVAGIWAVYLICKQSQERLNQKAREQQEQEQQRKQQEATEFEKLGDDTPLSKLLWYKFSQNDLVRRLCRERIAALPDLDEALAGLLDHDSDDAVEYIAKIYDSPPADLARAYARMLERKLKSLNFIQFEEHAGTRASNLKPYFTGARKLQQAGADLRPQLRAWLELLQKCQGLGSLAARVESLLEMESESG